MLKFHEYRADSRDVWSNLQSNWVHFFWMTGETPHTLSNLVQELEKEFEPHYRCGRKCYLDFRNQVCLFDNGNVHGYFYH